MLPDIKVHMATLKSQSSMKAQLNIELVWLLTGLPKNMLLKAGVQLLVSKGSHVSLHWHSAKILPSGLPSCNDPSGPMTMLLMLSLDWFAKTVINAESKRPWNGYDTRLLLSLSAITWQNASATILIAHTLQCGCLLVRPQQGDKTATRTRLLPFGAGSFQVSSVQLLWILCILN